MSEKTNFCKNKYELLPPDGGWGYFICIAGIIINTSTAGMGTAFGLLYNDFMTEIGMDSTIIGLVSGTNAISLSVAGFLTSPLLKLFSFRQLAMLATIQYNIGSLCLIVTRSVLSFFICQSLLQCFGYGILYNLTCTIINDYFVKRRLLAISVVQAVTAILTMVIPLLLKFGLQTYGYRGTLFIASAVSMQMFVATALMQPVTWHMKRIKSSENNEIKLLLSENKNGTTDEVPVIKVNDLDEISTAIEKLHSEDDKELSIKSTNAIKKVFIEIIDISLIKTYLLSYACTGLALAFFGDIIFSLMLPQALYSQNWSQDSVAWAIAMVGFGDLAARVSFVIFSKFLRRFKNSQLHLAGVFIAALSRLGLFLFKDVIWTLFFLTLAGVSRCFITTLIPLIISDATNSEKFTAAIGFFMLVIGVTNLSLGPLVGIARDATGNYDTVLWISFGFYILVIMLWIVEQCCKKYRHTKFYQKCSQK